MKQIDHLLTLFGADENAWSTGVSRQDFLKTASRTLVVSVAGGLAASCKTSQAPGRYPANPSTVYQSPNGQ